MRIPFAVCALSLALVAFACGDDENTGTGSNGQPTGSSGSTTASSSGAGGDTSSSTTSTGGGGAATSSSAGGAGGSGGQGGGGPFALTSTAYAEGEMIPEVYECQSGGGDNISPPLAWTPGPAGTQSYAIVMRDLDFMSGFIHWVIWDIPANVMSLPENVEQVYQPAVPAGAKQAPFNGNNVGYYGPCSPNSVNTYELTIYAIDVPTLPGLDNTTPKQEAAQAIVDAMTASAKLAGES